MYTLLLIQERRHGDPRTLLYPATPASELMLKHVANDSQAITEDWWQSTIKPLVNMHGWDWQINVVDKE